jgi:hypothetical protein
MSDDPKAQSASDPSAMVLADVMGRILALQFVVTRLLASHAEMFPDGVASRMMQDIDAVVNSVDNTMSPGIVLDAIKVYVRDYLEKAQDALDLGLSTKQED